MGTEQGEGRKDGMVKTLIASPFYNGARRSALACIRMAIEAARRLR